MHWFRASARLRQTDALDQCRADLGPKDLSGGRLATDPGGAAPFLRQGSHWTDLGTGSEAELNAGSLSSSRIIATMRRTFAALSTMIRALRSAIAFNEVFGAISGRSTVANSGALAFFTATTVVTISASGARISSGFTMLEGKNRSLASGVTTTTPSC